jgi:hypothetical protein
MDPTTIAQTLMAYAQPARPVTPTPMTTGTPPAPLPSWVPANVQNYIRTRPSFGEGERQGMSWGGFEPPQPPAPQIADIQRLFNRGILQNAPTGNQISGPPLKKIIQGGYLAGGNEI